MKINPSEFVSVLEKVKPGLTKDKLVEEGDHFIFNKNNVATFGNAICIFCPFETPFNGTIPASELYSFMSGLNSKKFEEVEVVQIGGEINLTTKDEKGGVSSSIALSQDSSTLDITNEISEKNSDIKFVDIPDQFYEALEFCIYSARKVESEFNIKSCIYFNGKTMYATDGVQLSRFVLDKEVPVPFLVQAQYLINLLKIDEEFKSIGTSDSWLSFKSEAGAIFNLRLWKETEDPPLDYEGVINAQVTQYEASKVNFPDDLYSDIELVEGFSEGSGDEAKRIQIDVKKDKIVLRSQNQKGKSKREVKFKNESEASFQINPKFLKDALLVNKSIELYPNVLCFELGNLTHVVAKVLNV